MNTSAAEIPVSWYSGYKLPELLAESASIASHSDVGSLLNKTWYAAFQLTDPTEPQTVLSLSSCADYFKHATQPLHTVQERDNAAFMEVVVMCNATKFIAKAIPAKQSFLSNLVFDATLPEKLPAQFAMVISVSERDMQLHDKSLKYWSQVNKITAVETNSPIQVTYRHDGGAQEVELVAKGDFNADGVEDVMLTSRDSVEDGSYSAIRLFTLTKLANDGDIKILSLH
jgi:hypothetical protein